MSLRLVVFDQTGVKGAALGPWLFMEVSVYQLVVALEFPIGARHPPSTRLYTVTPLVLPLPEDLHWNDKLDGQRELTQEEATRELSGGAPIQAFIYNGDSDCVRRHLVLPLGNPVFWLP